MRFNFEIAGILFITLQLIQGQQQRVTINVDTSRAPDLAALGRRVKATLEDYYPRAVQLLNSPTFQPVPSIDVRFDPNRGGVAVAIWQSREIIGSANHYRNNPNDIGSMIHEMAHIIQQYRGCPTWIGEGIADWVRYYNFQTSGRPAKPRPGATHYTRDVYRAAPYFLNWMNQRYRNSNIISRLNRACREGNYNENIFMQHIGRTPNQLWEELLRS